MSFLSAIPMRMNFVTIKKNTAGQSKLMRNHSRAYAFPIQNPLEQLNEWGIPFFVGWAKEKARNEALFGVNETDLIGICLPKVAEAVRVYTH